MPDAVATLLAAMHADPRDATAWLALADALEEDGQPRHSEILRLSRALDTRSAYASRPADEARLRELLAVIEPVVPELTNSIGMRLALIPAGEFWMGSPPEESQRFSSEEPRHPVPTRPFYLGVFVVTQSEYREVMGDNPSHFSRTGEGAGSVTRVNSNLLPVEQVTWDDCIAFCERLSQRRAEQDAGRVYRLPSEAEWEYACRAGTTTTFHFGNQLTWRNANFDSHFPYGTEEEGRRLWRTRTVGSYRPNAFGLYEMHGNVWEWCQDWHEEQYYAGSPRDDPQGPKSGTHRVLRGGCWNNTGMYLRSAHRGWSTADNRIGFRVAMNPPA